MTTTLEQSTFAIRRHCKCALFSHLQPLSRASGHKRYNTLDFPAENRVPSGTLFPYGTPCQQAVSHAYWMTRSRKESAALLWKPPGISFADCVYKPIISFKIPGSGNRKKHCVLSRELKKHSALYYLDCFLNASIAQDKSTLVVSG